MSSPDPWPRFAAEHGLAPDAAHAFMWRGAAHGVPVRLEVVPTGPSARGVRVAFTIGRPGLVVMSATLSLSGAGRTTTGDPDFDRDVHLIVTDPVDLGCFTSANRLRTLELVALGAHVVHGELRLEPWADLPDARVADVLMRATELARSFAQPRDDLIRSFAAIAAHDPEPRVKVRFATLAHGHGELASALASAIARQEAPPDDDSLGLLVRQLSDDSVGQKARFGVLVKLLSMFPPDRCAPVVRHLASDRATRVLVFRALLRQLHRPGLDVEPWLALLVDNLPGLPIPLDVAEAIARTCGASGSAAALPCLETLARDPEPRVFWAAMQALMSLPLSPRELLDGLPVATRRRAAHVGPALFGDRLGQALELVVMLHGEHGDELPVHTREAYMRAFAEHGDVRVQDLLLGGLEHFDERVKVAALDGLAKVGDGRALAAIRPLASGLFRSPRIKAAARAALDAIRARVGEGGGLALASGGASGGTSVAEDDGQSS